MNRDEDFRPLDWVTKKIPRAEAKQWWGSGYSLAEALRWRQHYGVEEAVSWRKAGITRVAEAQSWRVAGVDAEAVSGWRAAGIGFAEAAAWHEFGYELEEARKLKGEGKTPSESFRNRVQKMSSRPGSRGPRNTRGWVSYSPGPGSQSVAPHHPAHKFVEKLQATPNGGRLIRGYVQLQWLDDEALTWALQGIDAAGALIWKEFGISPADAAAAATEGVTAAAKLRAWWEAGIPPAELAAWFGAGFTPEEAAAQRAQGVGADRAAVLRALRQLDRP